MTQYPDVDRGKVEPVETKSGLRLDFNLDRHKRVKRAAIFGGLTDEIRDVIDSLPRRQREIVEAAYIDRAPLRQIALKGGPYETQAFARDLGRDWCGHATNLQQWSHRPIDPSPRISRDQRRNMNLGTIHAQALRRS